MKKFRKLFLSAAMFSALCVLAGGLTSNADDTTPTDPVEPSLTENFSFVEEFDYGDGSLVQGSGSNHNYGGATNAGSYVSNLVQEGDDNYLKVSMTRESGSEGGKGFSVRKSGTGNLVVATGDKKDVVIKAKFKTSQQHRKALRLYMCGTNYDVLHIYNNTVYYSINAVTSLKPEETDETKKKQFAEYEVFSGAKATSNDWHEAIFILRDNGSPVDGVSVDTISAYLDGKYLYTKSFFNGNDFTGTVGQFLLFFDTATKTSDDFSLDWVRAGDFNAPVATAPTVSDAKVSVPFELKPTFTGTNSAYLQSVTPSYTVGFSLNDTELTSETDASGMVVYKSGEEAIIGYENGNYVGLKAVNGLKATFNFDADLASSVSTTFNIAENREPIPVTDITVDKLVQNNTITLGVNEQFDVSKLFKAYPTTADDLTLEYTVGDDTVFGLEENVIKGVSVGSAKLTVTAVGGTNVKKEITVNVTKGSNYNSLNGFTLEDSWAEANQTHNGYTSKAYEGPSPKIYSPISVVEDAMFGNVIKFTGIGGANGGGSHLDYHIPAANLTANKDYKLTGWIKMEMAAGTSTGKIDIKLFDYFDAGKGNYGYSNSAAPYYGASLGNTPKDGWVYFETSSINFDTNALDREYIGLKVEIGTYNTQVGVDSYVAHLNLVELDTVTTAGWEVVNSNNKVLADKTELTQKTGTTYQLDAVALPSSGVVNATYASSDETIATVSNTGLVTFLNKAGKVNIVVTNGDVSKTISFNVNNPATSLTATENALELSIGDAFKELTVTVTPQDATSTYKVTVADETIVTADFVSGKLMVVPAKLGTTTITIVAEDNEEATLTVTVTVKGYTITYDAKGHGTAPEAVANVTKLPDELPPLTQEGFIFGGWFLDENCTQQAEKGAEIEANTTLYAKWTAEAPTTFKVTYNANGHGTAPTELKDVTALPAPLPTLTAEGWEFEGWYLDANCTTKAEAGKEITADTTLYAKWKKVEDTKPEPTPTPTPTPEEPKDSGVNVVAIVVPIVVVVVLAAAGALVYFLVFKKKGPKDKE